MPGTDFDLARSNATVRFSFAGATTDAAGSAVRFRLEASFTFILSKASGMPVVGFIRAPHDTPAPLERSNVEAFPLPKHAGSSTPRA